MSEERYGRWFRELEETPEYQSAGLEIAFTEELCRVMAEQGVSRAELARRAGTSPAYITKILRGSSNFTLATMAKLARALGMDVDLHLAPRGSGTVWTDQLSAQAASLGRNPRAGHRLGEGGVPGKQHQATATGASAEES